MITFVFTTRPVVILAFLIALAACSPDSSPRSAPPPPPAAPVVVVTMTDHRFDYDEPVPAGRVVFRVVNEGTVRHHLTMVPLAEDLPPIAEQLAGKERRLVKPFAGIYDREPGDSGTFAVDLAPGRRYALICSVVDENGEPHWRKGMVAEFRTPEPGKAADGRSS